MPSKKTTPKKQSSNKSDGCSKQIARKTPQSPGESDPITGGRRAGPRDFTKRITGQISPRTAAKKAKMTPPPKPVESKGPHGRSGRLCWLRSARSIRLPPCPWKRCPRISKNPCKVCGPASSASMVSNSTWAIFPFPGSVRFVPISLATCRQHRFGLQLNYLSRQQTNPCWVSLEASWEIRDGIPVPILPFRRDLPILASL